MSEQENQRAGVGEQEPLLGRPGDASLEDGLPLYHNLVIGMDFLKAGSWILVAIVWGAVFSNPVILFSAHPGVLILQPTHTPKQKKHGTWAHAGLNDLALSCGIAGLVVIEYNKIAHNGTHFVSPHAILGLITYILILIQGLVGFTQYFVPQIYGGEENAKKLYKYHRVSGYFIFLMLLATVAAATQTDYNKNVLEIKLWAVLVAAAITLIGVLPRVKKQKFGWLAGQ
ncbi:unnamed protein product [Aureobasidium vineae]|uniref:Cytochrome b561 domain-containing protein n=1 Tax=Aureobasidium vineae TaxID=2773715 RepID=A0A9N8J977_9PEZI|nr:unnamed protein product [Aureobasidium vineae]